MAIEYLKKADKTAATGEDDVRELVAGMLKEIEQGGEAKSIEFTRKFDNWEGDIVVSPESENSRNGFVQRKPDREEIAGLIADIEGRQGGRRRAPD